MRSVSPTPGLAAGVLQVSGLTFPRTPFAGNYRITFVKPAHIDSAIDLAGGFIVPPFDEAHNHNAEPTLERLSEETRDEIEVQSQADEWFDRRFCRSQRRRRAEHLVR